MSGMSRPLDLLIVTGEVSGDAHAARLVKGFATLGIPVRVRAMGSEALQQAGAEIVVETRGAGVIGYTEVLRMLPRLWRACTTLLEAVARDRPDAVILVDYPGFNLRLAEALRSHAAARVSSGDPLWSALAVVVSDAWVPGEGEHKIMQHIRSFRQVSPELPVCLWPNSPP